MLGKILRFSRRLVFIYDYYRNLPWRARDLTVFAEDLNGITHKDVSVRRKNWN